MKTFLKQQWDRSFKIGSLFWWIITVILMTISTMAQLPFVWE